MFRLLGLAFGSVLFMAVIALALGSRSHQPPASAAKAAVGKKHAGGLSDDFELTRDASGRFHLDAEINGEQARFLLDTGADGVALTLEDAERLGVPVDADNLQPIAQTASGVGYGAAVRIDRITIAGQEFRDVDALVIEGLTVNLLGRSLIARLGTLEMKGERMVIRRS
jgi:aspartyl protease family protein